MKDTGIYLLYKTSLYNLKKLIRHPAKLKNHDYNLLILLYPIFRKIEFSQEVYSTTFNISLTRFFMNNQQF